VWYSRFCFTGSLGGGGGGKQNNSRISLWGNELYESIRARIRIRNHRGVTGVHIKKIVYARLEYDTVQSNSVPYFRQR
jgi:hypothetical protein